MCEEKKGKQRIKRRSNQRKMDLNEKDRAVRRQKDKEGRREWKGPYEREHAFRNSLRPSTGSALLVFC